MRTYKACTAIALMIVLLGYAETAAAQQQNEEVQIEEESQIIAEFFGQVAAIVEAELSSDDFRPETWTDRANPSQADATLARVSSEAYDTLVRMVTDLRNQLRNSSIRVIGFTVTLTPPFVSVDFQVVEREEVERERQ